MAAVTTGVIARRQGGPGWRHGLLFLLAALVLTAAVNLALARRTDGGDGASAQLRLGQSYDLAGALARKPGLVLPLGADPELDRVLRSRGRALYTPLHNDPMAADPAVSRALTDPPDGVIAGAWRSLILDHPLLYLETRWAAFAAVLTTPDVIACHVAVIGVSGPPALLKRLGLTGGIRPQDQRLGDYAHLFFGTPVFSHLAWGGLALVLLVLLIRRGEPADLAVAGLLCGALRSSSHLRSSQSPATTAIWFSSTFRPWRQRSISSKKLDNFSFPYGVLLVTRNHFHFQSWKKKNARLLSGTKHLRFGIRRGDPAGAAAGDG